MLSMSEGSGENVLAVKATGELSPADWRAFLAMVEPVVKRHGNVRILFELDGFGRWDPDSPWAAPACGIRFKEHIRRFAVLGEEKDSKWMKSLAGILPCTRTFGPGERGEALRWLMEGTEHELEMEQIRRLAYARWEAAGRPPGDGVSFWLEAQKELHQAC